MNANINLVEILKDCPTGTEFYSPLFGKVTFDCITCSTTHPIKVISPNGVPADFNSSGKYYGYYLNSECLLFPSKDQRDWNVWKKEQDQKNIWNQFKDGDYLWMKQKRQDPWIFIYRKNINWERVQGYGCLSKGWDDTNYYTDIMEDYQYIGTKDEVLEIRKATIEQITLFDTTFKKKYNKKWNPITKKFEDIKTEMTISEIEKKLGLTSGSLRIKK